jgi:hypothetical protein
MTKKGTPCSMEEVSGSFHTVILSVAKNLDAVHRLDGILDPHSGYPAFRMTA